ncbi:MAG: SDR family NAD(P)-dependent oxidoreductase [Deltaproteobacteria bacterium]|nr:SDR family NAD(P)-dependent oxidoreductase [Deltaproteobacteria bacterium]
MANELRFDGKVAIITGAGQGLGRTHAMLLASRGAKVVVNDLGGSATGGGKSSAAADAVVAAIKEAGGEAVANYDSVEDGDKIVKTALDAFGRVDILINNAGILRDTSFQKMSEEDWNLIYRVHVHGAYKCTAAVWNLMRDQGYGRIVFTASAAGIYGNFGQANYAMAKLGLVGFANTLALEGKKKNVNVNVIAPIAGSRLTETVLPKELIDALKPEYVSPLVTWLCHDSCEETGGLFEVGGGFFGKLRWERTEGKLMKLGRPIAPEQVQAAWSQITDFGKTTHPTDITASMQPILGNLQSKSRGGNELIDVDEALDAPAIVLENSYDERDAALYGLAIGAAQDPLDGKDLQYVYEMHGDGFLVAPTFGVIPAMRVVMQLAKEGRKGPGLNFGFERILHGEQYTEVKRPLPAHAKLRHEAKVKDIFDKGKNAVVINGITTYDAETGEELVYNELTTFVRGAGGWGGERGPTGEQNPPPDRAPDAVITEKTTANQALLYRLTGDWNPLHADPNFAQAFGFQKPILHGLCTFGFVARHAIKSFAGNDGRLFKSIKVRFAESVYPGETLKTEMWKESDTRIIVRCTVVEREKVVISNAAVELYTEVPKPKAKAAPKAAAASAPAASGGSGSAAVFAAIGAFVAQSPDLAGKVGKTYLFKLKSPDSAWLVDLKNGKGAVSAGEAKADCTLELTDADFMDMVSGKADAQKLYFAGKVKISGDVMASQKLEKVFKGVDPKAVQAALAGGGGAAPAAAASAPAAAASGGGEPSSAEIFAAMGEYLAHHPEVAAKVGNVYVFKLQGPDSAWTLDLKNGGGGVTPGEAKADCTLAMSDADFLAMSSGKADPQKLYFGGKLKITGNVMASQKLEVLFKAMTPEESKKALDAVRAKGGAAAPVAAASSGAGGAQAPAIFAALAKRVAESPALAKEVGAVVQFVVKDPAAAWVLDGATVKEGKATAALTLTMTDEDLGVLAKGDESLQALYQQGKIRADGDVLVAHRLGLLKKLI